MPTHSIRFVEINWLDLYDAIKKTGLSATCVYTRDFENLLKDWYMPMPLKFTTGELQETSMFSPTAATAVAKVFDFIEKMGSEFERAGFKVARAFQKRWWQGEYGLYIRCGEDNVMWFGLWSSFWRDRGYPICIGVHRIWAPEVVTRFQSAFPRYVTFPPQDANPYLTVGVDQHYLMEDAVKDVSDWLLRGYLNGICSLVGGDKRDESAKSESAEG